MWVAAPAKMLVFNGVLFLVEVTVVPNFVSRIGTESSSGPVKTAVLSQLLRLSLEPFVGSPPQWRPSSAFFFFARMFDENKGASGVFLLSQRRSVLLLTWLISQ